MHLADAFIQSDLQCIQIINFLSVHAVSIFTIISYLISLFSFPILAIFTIIYILFLLS